MRERQVDNTKKDIPIAFCNLDRLYSENKSVLIPKEAHGSKICIISNFGKKLSSTDPLDQTWLEANSSLTRITAQKQAR